MRNRNWNRRFGIQRLEDRRLLAADVALTVDLASIESAEPEICQVCEVQTVGESESEGQVEELDLDSTALETDVSVATEIAIDNTDAVAETSDDAIHDLGDPADGTDGFFGSIDAENSSQQFSFSPSEEGIVDIVVASSFGDAETRIEVTNSSGEMVVSTINEELDGFQQVSFEADAGENYLLTVSSDVGTEGLFQVTVGHSELVDQHADTIGESSTELSLIDSTATLDGELETAGDIDTFRFTADADGRATLGLAELDADNATELSVQVLDSAGEQVSRGITNETLGISFDVEAGSEYFISVNAAEGETGSYRIDLSVEADVIESETEPVVEDDIVDEVVDDSTTDDAEVVGEVDETVTETEPSGDVEIVDELIEEVVDETEVVDSTEDTELVDSTEDAELIDSTDEAELVEAIDDSEVADSTEETDLVSEEQTTEEETVEVVDSGDATLTDDTTSGDELASSEEASLETDVDAELQADTAVTEETEADPADLAVECEPIPVDVVDAETSEIPVDVIEVADSTTEDLTSDLPESFELVGEETEDDAPTATEIAISEVVEDLADAVRDAADHLDTVGDLISEKLGLSSSDVSDAEQAIDSFFSDTDLVDELVSL